MAKLGADDCIAMKLIAATIWANFETSITDDAGIEQEDAYTAAPQGRRLLLQLRAVDLPSGA